MKYTYILIRTFLDGLNNNIAKLTVNAMPISHLLVIRTFLILLVSLTGIRSLFKDLHIIKGNKKLQIDIFISCAISTIASILFYKGLLLIPVSVVAVVNNTFHIVSATVLGILFFKQKHSLKFFILLLALIPATGLVLAPNLDAIQKVSWVGVSYLALSALLYSTSFHLTGVQVKKINIQSLLILRSLSSLICLLIVAVIVRDSIAITLEALSLIICLMLIYTAISSFIMRLLHLKSLKEIGATASTILTSLSPIFTILIAMVVFQETIDLIQWVGVICTMAILYFITKN